MAVMEVPWEEAPRFGLMVADEDDRITAFQEKPKEPQSNLASMGIYIFNWDVLRKYLIEDEANPDSENDFGKNVIPSLLRDGRRMYAYHFSGYWKDVGTISSLWEANMEVLDPENSGINLFEDGWKVYSRNSGMTGHRIGTDARVEDSMITDGCRINGDVRHSVLFAGVRVEHGATVEDAVVMGGTVIEAGAQVRHCIIAENVVIGAGAAVGQMPEAAPDDGRTVLLSDYTRPAPSGGQGSTKAESGGPSPAAGLTGGVATVASGVHVGAGAWIGPQAMVSSDVKEGERVC